MEIDGRVGDLTVSLFLLRYMKKKQNALSMKMEEGEKRRS